MTDVIEFLNLARRTCGVRCDINLFEKLLLVNFFSYAQTRRRTPTAATDECITDGSMDSDGNYRVEFDALDVDRDTKGGEVAQGFFDRFRDIFDLKEVRTRRTQ